PLQLPALRQRREDIPMLVDHFVEQVCTENGWKPMPFTTEAIHGLQAYAWPGNVRELRNAVERLMLLAKEGEVGVGVVEMAIPQSATPGSDSTATAGPLSDRVQSFERQVILAELKRNHSHVTNTAKALGLERSHLYKKCEMLG